MKKSEPTAKRLDRSDPDWGRLARETREGSFVREGTFVAFPLCFPGVTIPIPREASRIVTLTTDHTGMVYGATTGQSEHVFFACFQANSGIVLDLKWPDPAARCPAIACGPQEVIFACNPPKGGSRLLRRKLQEPPGDLLHEWSFRNHPFEEAAGCLFDDPVLDLVQTRDRQHAVVATRQGCGLYDFTEQLLVDWQPVPVAGRLGAIGDSVFGFDDKGFLWRYTVPSRQLERTRQRPDGAFAADGAFWAADGPGHWACLVGSDGRLFQLQESGILEEQGQLPLLPVTAATVTPDGRLFAFAGEGIAHFFVHDLQDGSIRNHGAAVSVLERRRYGYAFASATTGINGELIFGEADDAGHLWLYFPSLRPPRQPATSPPADPSS